VKPSTAQGGNKMEELKLERISDRQLEDIENKYPRKYRIAQTTANAQLKADQQVLTIVVDKLKAEITRLKEENRCDNCLSNRDVIEAKHEAEKKEMIERLDRYVYEDELGFVGISNHIPFAEYEDFKAKYLKEK
jgi:alkylhydroperoxidase family enzyme